MSMLMLMLMSMLMSMLISLLLSTWWSARTWIVPCPQRMPLLGTCCDRRDKRPPPVRHWCARRISVDSAWGAASVSASFVVAVAVVAVAVAVVAVAVVVVRAKRIEKERTVSAATIDRHRDVLTAMVVCFCFSGFGLRAALYRYRTHSKQRILLPCYYCSECIV